MVYSGEESGVFSTPEEGERTRGCRDSAGEARHAVRQSNDATAATAVATGGGSSR